MRLFLCTGELIVYHFISAQKTIVFSLFYGIIYKEWSVQTSKLLWAQPGKVFTYGYEIKNHVGLQP